jgi:Flp pilus assembly CpaF family ATPase
MAVKRFEDLEVWKEARRLTHEICQLSKGETRRAHVEKYGRKSMSPLIKVMLRKKKPNG